MSKMSERWGQAKEQWWVWRTAHPTGSAVIFVSLVVLMAYWIGWATA